MRWLLIGPIDFQRVFFPILWKSEGSINSLVTHILKGMCVQQKRDIHTVSEQLEGKLMMTIFILR